MTVAELLRRSTDELQASGVPSPRVDAEHLLGHALGLSRLDLYLHFDRLLSTAELAECRELIRRRATREPLAYILGEWGFRRLTLTVDGRALIPRPETEVVVERCLVLLAEIAEPAVLDVGTGTGAIALAIADEHRGARVTAIDLSGDALALARENAARTGLTGRVRLVRHDLVDGLPGGPYDLVAANPPYVRSDELETLPPEVRDFEPRLATVDVGQTRALILSAGAVLARGGWIVLETHGNGAREIEVALRESGYGSTRVTEDLAGRERVAEGRWST